MPYKLLLPAQTKAQLDVCIAYIAQVLRNPDAARAVLDNIVHTYERLEHLPETFPLCDDTYLRAKAYQKITLLHITMCSSTASRGARSTSLDSFTCVKTIVKNYNTDRKGCCMKSFDFIQYPFSVFVRLVWRRIAPYFTTYTLGYTRSEI